MTEDDRIIPFPRIGPRNGPRNNKSKCGCPICGKPCGSAYQPFCSERCQQVDLGRWLKETYRIPTEEQPGEQEAGADDET